MREGSNRIKERRVVKRRRKERREGREKRRNGKGKSNSRVLAVSQHIIATAEGSRGISEHPITRHIWKQICTSSITILTLLNPVNPAVCNS